ncbi:MULTISPECIES: arylesterase [unclassified Neptuniibacter]|uniref:arylesterase n=1 Tax=unclassified Neptuniibacter TaxID=2630693 RepID=UPI000C692D34|nr:MULTISPECIES: arylesterase [unclassified Neptuniibacter]MAY41850.1 arylesterase [Oceanospirillaceae bacterium]|tara:strand:- start:14328 stop:14945 length:618 start_codon:yes stop_codon:yes gene_type:complete
MRILQTILLLIITSVTLTLPAQARSLVVLGDSLSAAYNMKTEQGWVQLLENRLREEGYSQDIINASVSGDTTQNGIARLKLLLQQVDAQIVIIELGGNDGLRGTPPFAIQRNLQRLIDMSEQADAKVLLLGMQLPPNYGAAYTQKFSELYAEVAEDKEVAFVPFFMEKVALVPERMQADGIHPSSKGQPYLLDTVWPILEPLLDE